MPGDARDTQPNKTESPREDPPLREGPTEKSAPDRGDAGGRPRGVIDLSYETDHRSPDHHSPDHHSGTVPPRAELSSRDGRIAAPRDPSVGDGSHAETDVGTRERIVQAAADVFLEKGFTGTRVVDIARRAGYTSGVLYGYFDSRAELLAEAVARGSSQMLSRLLGTESDAGGDQGGGSSTDDPVSVLKSAFEQISSPIDESDQMLLDGIALAHREPVAGDRLAHTVEEFRSELAHPERGGLGEDAADMLVVLVLGITAARALGWHDPPSPEMREHIADSLLTSSASAPGS